MRYDDNDDRFIFIFFFGDLMIFFVYYVNEKIRKTKSLLAHIRIVRLGVINLCKNTNNRFWELIHLDIPLLQQVNSIFRLEAADVEKYTICAEFLVNQLKSVFQLSLGQAIQ